MHDRGIASNVAARVVAPERRSLAFGIVSAAGSMGTFFCAPLGQLVISHGGWRRGAGGVPPRSPCCMLPAAFIGGRADRLPNSSARDKDMTLLGALNEARRHGGYVVMSLAFFVCGLQLVFLTTHLPSYLALCGMDPLLGAQALAVIGLFNVIGSWGFGWLGDRYRKRTLLGLLYMIRSLVIATYFMLPVTPTSTLIFAALMGLTWLGVIPLLNGLVVQMFGIKFLSTLTGIAFFSHQQVTSTEKGLKKSSIPCSFAARRNASSGVSEAVATLQSTSPSRFAPCPSLNWSRSAGNSRGRHPRRRSGSRPAARTAPRARSSPGSRPARR